MRSSLRVIIFFFTLGLFACSWLSFLFAEGESRVSQYRLMQSDASVQPANCKPCHSHYKTGLISSGQLGDHRGMELNHMPEIKECSFCHSSKSPNQLNLLDGTQIHFEETYKLCAQCHGKIIYDWQHGIHGRLTGRWDGEKSIYSCTLCHNAHDPKFKSMNSTAKPIAPKYVIQKSKSRQE